MMPTSSRAKRAAALLYQQFAPCYDVIYGVGLEPGRARALERLAPAPGETILEVGVGTGLSAVRYPRTCRTVAVDLSASMLARAKARLERRNARHVALCRMDAGKLAFREGQFDAVYAPYLDNVVPDPARVAREMLRVCRRGGRLVFLNHFRLNPADPGAMVDGWIGRVATAITGVNWDLELAPFLDDAGLTAVSVERVNLPPVSSVVLCRKP
jgi:phosphatidylethanolamine/phosphatidyl-N-methylethanolamine N-methyltransferase